MPRQQWSDKDERQYEHVKASEKRRGRSEERAKAIAAASVNQQRLKEGRTRRKTTQGTGNPNESLEQRTRQQVYNIARELGISGRSRMNKAELIRAVRRKR